MLFNKILFGPVQSRRLGTSLGINLLPEDMKLCSMNCIYCECGWGKTKDVLYSKLLKADEIIPVIEEQFRKMNQQRLQIDSLTYSGNGEPTLHPQFSEINNAVIRLRNLYFPQTMISCLSNSTQLHREDIVTSLLTIDNPQMKLDAGTQNMFERINKPYQSVDIDRICTDLRKFDGKLTIQTLFLRGILDDILVDNTTQTEVNTWIERLAYIRPHTVLLYPIDRATPAHQLEKIDLQTLNRIAQQVQSLGIKTKVYQ